MSNFIQVTPFMHVDNLDRALAFFTGILGFETQFRAPDYAYLHRETVGFRILEQKGPDGAPPGNRRFAYYIDVRDVDRLFAELKPKLDTPGRCTDRSTSTTASVNFSSSRPTAT